MVSSGGVAGIRANWKVVADRSQVITICCDPETEDSDLPKEDETSSLRCCCCTGSLFGSKRRTARTTPTARLPSPDQKAQGKFEWRRAGRIISKVGSISVGLHAIDVLAHRRRRLGLKLFQIGFGIQRWTALLIKRRKPKTE